MKKSRLILTGLAGLWGVGRAGILTFNVGLGIPDGSGSGLASTGMVSGEGLVTSLSVGLEISGVGTGGAYNGDLYVTLQHVPSGKFAVLVNRPGKASGDDYGYGDNGLQVTLVQHGAPDIHTYQDQQQPAAGNPLTGIWSADNRYADPADVLTSTSSPLTTLDDFLGIDPNGAWILFAADLEQGGQAQLDAWTLNFNLVPIPEPGPLTFIAALALGLWATVRRRT